MARFKMYIEYDGTRYSGWQVQKNARTIQGELLNAGGRIFNTGDIEIYGSGRTDAGVHALMQVAHLDVKTMLAPEIIRMKFNDELPADINILEVEKAASKFHARHDAVRRVYLYQISKRRTAFGKRYVWWIKDALDVNRMRNAAQFFAGMQNMQSFTADDPDEKSPKVLIEDISVQEEETLILIRMSGSHFLWKMVRQIVGILVEVGRGNIPLERVRSFLGQSSHEPAKYTAPPSGLFLERVHYHGEHDHPERQPLIRVGAEHLRRKAIEGRRHAFGRKR